MGPVSLFTSLQLNNFSSLATEDKDDSVALRAQNLYCNVGIGRNESSLLYVSSMHSIQAVVLFDLSDQCLTPELQCGYDIVEDIIKMSRVFLSVM